MSSPALQPRTRVSRIAQDAVDKARLTVVPRVRSRAPRVPFVTLVSLVLVAGVVGLLLYSALFLYPCLALRRSADRWPLVAALLALFVMEMLTVSEYGYLPPWFLLGMAYARLAQERAAERPPFRGVLRA